VVLFPKRLAKEFN